MSKKTGEVGRETVYLQDPTAEVKTEHGLYQSLSIEEDIERTNRHYEHPTEFWYGLTGGEWNVYSCNLWHEGVTTQTESQEAKLDKMAQYMELEPGKRILDVGCGWAGPITYLSKTYDVQGVGLTLSPTQLEAANQRIAKHGADVDIHICHWKDFEDD
ncbi:MAG TPA: class I SAM-dependent methyltransferase, partial [Aggregatilineales bacterium]|nr:class I SAM-dependent methyltransferase [Aggregatilineales bacterium]